MANDNLLIPSGDLLDAYSSGRIMGCRLDDPMHGYFERKAAREGTAMFNEQMPYPEFEKSAFSSVLAGTSKGKLCTPWKYTLLIDKLKSMFGAQATGDCVSWAIRMAIDLTRIYEILVLGNREEYIVRQATAMLYASRGHTGQGADPARVSMAATKDGILLEQTYLDGKYDFTDYSKYVRIGMNAGRTGLPEELKAITRKNRVKTATRVRDMDALADLLWNGYGSHAGSSIGVSSIGNPLSVLKGSWSHDMAIVGFDDTRKYFPFRVWFWDQSWGNWNKVTNIPPEWMPFGQGMFALSEDDTWQAVRAGGCYAFSDTDGFVSTRGYDNSLLTAA